MIRPFTCICLVLAAGSGLYLYQVKQRAFALDADLRSTFHDIDMARQKTRMLRADWALMNDPERLQALSTQYLTLKPMGPSQLMTLDQLAAALPAPVKPGSVQQPVTPDDGLTPATDPTHGVPMAAATPLPTPAQPAGGPAVALLDTNSANAAPAAPVPPANVAQVPDLPSAAALPPPPKVASLAAPSDAATLRAARHAVRHAQVAVAHAATTAHPAAAGSAVTAGTALADAAGRTVPAVEVAKPHHTHHKTAAPKPDTQYFAANETPHAAYGGDRITPPAATVMYSPGGSSLGMASSAALAPPRPLYSTTQ